MPRANIVVECPIYDSFRVQQVAGMFDVPLAAKMSRTFDIDVPDIAEEWSIGLIVGPSGSGKSTIARNVFGESMYHGDDWPNDKAVVDCFGNLSIKNITHALTAVGFSSPPSWVKPYHVLSNGEKFRCDLAKGLLSENPLVVFDEFTSVVDRTVAKIGSAAVSKAIRSGKISRRFVAVSCHYDIAEWLEPDWVVDMSSQTLARGRLRRPEIKLEIHEGSRAAWPIFRHHHYMSGNLHKSCRVFLGLVDGEMAAFVAILPSMGFKGRWRGHRIVVLPDYQGIGIGNRMVEAVAEQLWAKERKRYGDVTSSPSLIAYRKKRANRWALSSKVFRQKQQNNWRSNTSSANRLTTSWTYIPSHQDAALMTSGQSS